MTNNIKVIISGGGTGGHIFPAIAIANAIKQKVQEAQILFVGASGKMEMEKVPQAGYEIEGLPVVGLQRKISFSFFTTIIKLFRSLQKAKKIIRNFKPDVVVGVGGYASGPVLRIAVKKNIPALIQEQNSFAGLTNKILGQKVNKVCVAYDKMEKYFPREKIVFTGNPVRKDFLNTDDKKEEARQFFHISKDKVLFITGGSLGARTLNEAVLQNIDRLIESDMDIIWQAGKLYINEINEKVKGKNTSNIRILDFISRMDFAYAVADVIICRSGALTCAELAVTAKPAILVPSPNVAEDHQTKNALAFTAKSAALMIKDNEASDKLVDEALKLINDTEKQKILKTNMKVLAKTNADEDIADEVIKLCMN